MIFISHAFFAGKERITQKDKQLNRVGGSCCRVEIMANIEMLLSRSSSPSKRSPPAPRNRLDSTCFSDGETTQTSHQKLVATPPPDYERYLSDSELPSARYSRSPRPAFTVSRVRVDSCC